MANLALVTILTKYGTSGYMYTILGFSILLILTLSFPVYSLYIKIKKNWTQIIDSFFLIFVKIVYRIKCQKSLKWLTTSAAHRSFSLHKIKSSKLINNMAQSKMYLILNWSLCLVLLFGIYRELSHFTICIEEKHSKFNLVKGVFFWSFSKFYSLWQTPLIRKMAKASESNKTIWL